MRLELPSRALLAALLLFAPRAHAEPLTSPTPVDQGVADVDPLSTSLRRLEAGLSPLGQASALFLLPADQAPPANAPPTSLHQLDGQSDFVYYRVAQGYRLRVDRIDYLVRDSDDNLFLNHQPRKDGEYREIPGPNSYFDLSPLDPLTALPPAAIPLPDRPPAFEFDALIDRRKTSDRDAEASLFHSPDWPNQNPNRITPTDPQGRIDARIDNRVDNRLR
ncbi:MAG: hypothetical protein IT442_05930 [Phycisphaeraceae bacterium]|nr:hypothetical protein [Phycisphaeraceae bacterium]